MIDVTCYEQYTPDDRVNKHWKRVFWPRNGPQGLEHAYNGEAHMLLRYSWLNISYATWHSFGLGFLENSEPHLPHVLRPIGGFMALAQRRCTAWSLSARLSCLVFRSETVERVLTTQAAAAMPGLFSCPSDESH